MPSLLDLSQIVRPETILRWHRVRISGLLELEIARAGWPAYD
jgi:hypothetical protein